MVSSGKPSALCTFVISLDTMVPVVRSVFFIGNEAFTFYFFSIAGLAAANNCQSNTSDIK